MADCRAAVPPPLAATAADQTGEQESGNDTDSQRPCCRTIGLSFNPLLQAGPLVRRPLARLAGACARGLSRRFPCSPQVIFHVGDVSCVLTVRTCRCGHFAILRQVPRD